VYVFQTFTSLVQISCIRQVTYAAGAAECQMKNTKSLGSFRTHHKSRDRENRGVSPCGNLSPRLPLLGLPRPDAIPSRDVVYAPRWPAWDEGHTLSEPDRDNSPQPRYSRYWQHSLGSCRRAVTTREHELITTFRWSFGNCKAIDGSCDIDLIYPCHSDLHMTHVQISFAQSISTASPSSG
jgi:hypothetical protein